MEMLGYSQIRLALNSYSYVLPSLPQAVAIQIAAVLGGR